MSSASAVPALHRPENSYRESRFGGERPRRRRAIAGTPRRAPLQVGVEWSGAAGAEASRPLSGKLEIEARAQAGGAVSWVSAEPAGGDWEEALAASRCAEVVLTIRSDRDLAARHLVLGLAERLTHKLAKTQSLVVVRFLTNDAAAT